MEGLPEHNITEDVPPQELQICIPSSTTTLVLLLIPTCVILLAVILGNFLVIIAFLKQRSLRTPPNVYLVSLAFVDLAVGLFVLPLNIQNHVQGCWTLGKTACKFYSTADITLCVMSILHLCAIAIDRYRAIKDGVRYIHSRSLKTVLFTILGIAITSLWISSPPILGWDKKWLENIDEDKNCHLMNSVGYRVYSAFGALFLPLVLMILVYTKIYYAIQDRLRNKFPLKQEEMSEESKSTTDEHDTVSIIDPFKRKETTLGRLRRDSKLSEYLKEFMAKKEKFSLSRERRAAKTLGLIMGCFIVCWVPFGLLYVLIPVLSRCCSVHPPADWVFELLTWLGYLNSALNPVIYGAFNSEFREAFKKVTRVRKSNGG